MNETIRKILESATHHFTLLFDNLTDDGKSHSCSSESFNSAEFCNKIGACAKEITFISSQLTMELKGTESLNVSEIQNCISGLQGATENLITTFQTLSKSSGTNLYQSVKDCVVKTVRNLVSLVNCFNPKGGREKMDCFKAVGLVWSSCEELIKLPKNNLEATLITLRSEEILLCDALQEIDEEVKNDASALNSGEDIDNSEVWNNQDRELLSPCMGLVKTARTCLKKVIAAVKSQGDASTETNCSQLDSLTYIVVELSPAVDNFVSTMYPPVDRKLVKTAAIGVVNIIQNLLKQVQKQHFIKEEDHQWINFLLKAVDHNNNKLQPLLYPEGVED